MIRHKLRFVGITCRQRTSPKTWHWQQHAEWTADLPARAIVNVSMSPAVWPYLGDLQPNATVSFRPHLWLDQSVAQPARDERQLRGLAEAVALVAHGAKGDT